MDIGIETEVAVAAGGWLAGKGVDVLRAAGGMTGRGGGGGIRNRGLAFETCDDSVDMIGRTGRGALAVGDRADRDSSLVNRGRPCLNMIGLGCWKQLPR